MLKNDTYEDILDLAWEQEYQKAKELMTRSKVDPMKMCEYLEEQHAEDSEMRASRLGDLVRVMAEARL